MRDRTGAEAGGAPPQDLAQRAQRAPEGEGEAPPAPEPAQPPPSTPVAGAPLPPTDEELEARWKEGSAPAFALLFERYHARVFAFALRMTHDRHMAEDLAQRAFLNLYRKPPPGTGRATFKALVFTVVRNEAINDLKRRGRRHEASLDAVAEEQDGRPSPSADAAASDDARRLSRALAELPDEERSIVLLREAEGLSFREVCEATGLTRDAVRWRLARGMERLRELLGGRGRTP